MPAIRNVGPSRRSESFDHDQERLQHVQSSGLGSTSISTGNSSPSPRVIYTPGLSSSDSTLGVPSTGRPRLILNGPRAKGDGETKRKGSLPSISPALHTPPSLTFPDNSKRRRISASLYISTPPLPVSQEASEPSVIARKPTTLFTPSRPRRKKDKDYIPRPKNAFILFRSEFYQKFTQAAAEESLRNLDQANISQQAAWKWNTLNEDEKKPYMTWAAAEKEAHAVMYPGYSFTPDKKPKSPRKRSRTLKRKALDDSGDMVEPPPSEASSQHHLQSSLALPPTSPALGFSLRPASWGAQGVDEPGSRMNPITESSPYMNLSDEEAPADFEATRPKDTNITESQRSEPTSTLPANSVYNHGSEPSLHQSTSVLVEDNNHAGVVQGKQTSEMEVKAVEGSGLVPLMVGGTTDTQYPHVLQIADGHLKLPTNDQLDERSVYRLRSASSTTTLGESASNSVALVGNKVLEAVDKRSRHTADRTDKQLTYQPLNVPPAGGAQHFKTGATESLVAVRERPTRTLGVHFNSLRVVDEPFIVPVPPAVDEGVGRGLNIPSHPEHRPQFMMHHSGMSQPVPPSISAEERKRRFATSRFRVMSEEPPAVPPVTSAAERKRRFATSRFRVMSEEPPLVPPTMSAAERKRRFSTSRFRVMSEEPPTIPPVMSADERKRRFATSRFRVMSEEPPLVPPAMTSVERNRRFATSRFRVMSEEPTVPPTMSSLERKRRFATSRFRVMPEEPQLSLLQRTSRFLNCRTGRPNKPTFSQKYQPSAIPDGFDLGLTSAASLSPFPPLQFTPGNIPEAYSVRILGLNFMAC